MGGRSDRGVADIVDEPRQCDCDRCGGQWQRAAVDHRPGHQRSADRCRRRADHGAADRLPLWSGPARRCWAGLRARSSRPIRRSVPYPAGRLHWPDRGRARRLLLPRSAWCRSSPITVMAAWWFFGIVGIIIVLVVGSRSRRSAAGKGRRGFAECGLRRTSHQPHDRPGAADQPRQLLEAAADAVADEINHPVLEHQRQLAATALENGSPATRLAVPPRSDARPEGRAEHLGAFHHRWRHQFATDRAAVRSARSSPA